MPDGRYLVRGRAEAELEAVLVLTTLGAPERRLLGGRRGRQVEEAAPEPVPTARITVVRPEPFGSPAEAEEWLEVVRSRRRQADEELAHAVRLANRAVRAWRAAAVDPYAAELSAERALAVRIGFGRGDTVAEGRFAAAWELPPAGAKRTRRSMEAPEERFAALIGGRQSAIPAEELVIRARADVEAGRTREAALQARVALESLLADLPHAELEGDRRSVGQAANAALGGDLPEALVSALHAALARMEAALRRSRLGG